MEELRQQVVVDSVIKNSGSREESATKRFVRMAEKFVNIDDLDINLIDSVNPFQRAFEVLSKSVTPNVLRIISGRSDRPHRVTEEEALVSVAEKFRRGPRSAATKPTCADPVEKRRRGPAVPAAQEGQRETAKRASALADDPEAGGA